ncbi:MAG: dihydroorotate dehydrogenase electron transfer subunit [Eubacteriales bacterium]|nr:dihydroorotate dehydrogenase electron transfer subunit [Eubacteriales bacterium]
MFKKVVATVKENSKIAAGIYKMIIACGDADIRHFVPGQFADIAVPGHAELLLRRPISISAVNPDNNTAALIYQIQGKGTDIFSRLTPQTKIDAIMPVGRGFYLTAREKTVFLVGGGVGIAPLLSVTQKWPSKTYEAFLGYKGRDYAYCLDDFENACGKVIVTSDDGTLGEKGFVTDALGRRLIEAKPDIVLACGPVPMLRALKDILSPFGVPAQVSMEQRMCCGFGACATCVCGVDHGEGLEYKKVCIEGPVFDLFEVVL